MTIAGIALMMALGAAGQPPATNPCLAPSSETSMLTGTTAKLYAELSSHQQFLPGGGPNDFVTTGYEYKAYNAMSGNPEVGPFLVQQTIPRGSFVLVSGTPDCYLANVNNPTLEPWTIFKATLTAINQGGIPNSAPSDPSNPFVSARTRVGAVRLAR
jgi:hypothetical protein